MAHLRLALVACLAAASLPFLAHAAPRPPRGVAPADAHLYAPNQAFFCMGIAGLTPLPPGRVNDGYCDCVDASDEPGVCIWGVFGREGRMWAVGRPNPARACAARKRMLRRSFFLKKIMPSQNIPHPPKPLHPGTAACPNGKFYCANAGHVLRVLNSSFVDDGVCGEWGATVWVERERRGGY